MQPYLVIIALKPTQKQVYDEGAVDQIVVQPQAVLADTDVQAAAKAMRFVPDEMKGKEDRLEVWSLPFRRGSA
jgi:hypothetical protein